MLTGKSIRGVLFDKDGTLIDFHSAWLPAYRAAAERVSIMAGNPGLAARLLHDGGWDDAAGTWRPGSLLACGSNREIVERWASLARLDAVDDVATAINDTFHDTATRNVRSVSGIAALLTTLSERGLRLGIATMDSERTAISHARAIGIESMLDFVCGADSGHGEKPGPGMLHAFCRYTGIDANEVMMVGDSPHDLNMGRAAGAGLVVGVLSGAHGLNDLRHLADYVVDDATHVVELLR